jgi:hypothetical protein
MAPRVVLLRGERKISLIDARNHEASKANKQICLFTIPAQSSLFFFSVEVFLK